MNKTSRLAMTVGALGMLAAVDALSQPDPDKDEADERRKAKRAKYADMRKVVKNGTDPTTPKAASA